jgi:hypothetical protein
MTRPRPPRRCAQELLERWYQRLLACYPGSYRAANAEEMIGVALAGAVPGQHRPSLGEAASLVAAGLRMRGSVLLAGARGTAWAEAGAAVAIIGPVLLAAINAERVTGSLAWSAAGVPGQLRPADILLAAGWSLVAAAAILGWRRAAVAGASLAAVGEAVRLAARYAGDPASLVTSWWQLMLAVTVALAAIVALSPAAAARRPLTRRAIGGTLAAAALAVAAPAISAAFTTVTPLGSGGAALMSSPLDGVAGYLRYGLFALIAVTVMTVVAGIARPARRRVLIMTLPVGAAAALTAWGFGGFLAASGRFTPPVMLTAPQWAALAAVPLLSFAAAATWLSRHERMLRVSAEGQEALVQD